MDPLPTFDYSEMKAWTKSMTNNVPFVLKGMMDDWPALTRWWDDSGQLCSSTLCPMGSSHQVEILVSQTSQFTGYVHSTAQTSVDFAAFLRACRRPSEDTLGVDGKVAAATPTLFSDVLTADFLRSRHCYLCQCPIYINRDQDKNTPEQLPHLLQDIRLPEWISPSDLTAVNLWLSAGMRQPSRL